MIGAPRYRVDQRDVQGNILAGYGNSYRNALYLFLRIDDASRGRRWLGGLIDDVTTALPWNGNPKPMLTLNVALTWDGLLALGLPGPMLETFPEEFRTGMAGRCDVLGDTGASAPYRWQDGLRGGQPHALVTIYALDPGALDDERDRRVAAIEHPNSGVHLILEQPAELLGGTGSSTMREHFGFADGLGQPTIRGNAGPEDRPGGGIRTKYGWRPVAPGEFVLGYPEEDGTYADTPAQPLRMNGSFTVVRKLYQDVGAFTTYLRGAANGRPGLEEKLAAKLVGRWRDGTPVEVSPDAPDARLAMDRGPDGKINDFHYSDDEEGMRCPLGAHIRRANPRDALGWEGRLTMRHRIIRRGMPYGPPPRDPAVGDRQDRGLVFVCHQASIARQFEVVQGQWLSDGDAFWLGVEQDALRADHQGATVTIPALPPTFLPLPHRPLVVTRGGAYLFSPGITALRHVASAGWL